MHQHSIHYEHPTSASHRRRGYQFGRRNAADHAAHDMDRPYRRFWPGVITAGVIAFVAAAARRNASAV
jgi:hypothetical protein